MSGIFSRWGRSKAQADDNGSAGNGAAPIMQAAGPSVPAASSGSVAPAPVVAMPMSVAPSTPAPAAQPAPASNGNGDAAFVSTMMDFPLTLQHTLSRAATLFPDREIVTNTADGPQRTTYGAWARRVNRLAYVLDKLGVKKGDRVGDAGLEHRRAPRVVLRRAVHRRGAAYTESAPLPAGFGLHHQRCRRTG